MKRSRDALDSVQNSSKNNEYAEPIIDIGTAPIAAPQSGSPMPPPGKRRGRPRGGYQITKTPLAEEPTSALKFQCSCKNCGGKYTTRWHRDKHRRLEEAQRLAEITDPDNPPSNVTGLTPGNSESNYRHANVDRSSLTAAPATSTTMMQDTRRLEHNSASQKSSRMTETQRKNLDYLINCPVDEILDTNIYTDPQTLKPRRTRGRAIFLDLLQAESRFAFADKMPDGSVSLMEFKTVCGHRQAELRKAIDHINVATGFRLDRGTILNHLRQQMYISSYSSDVEDLSVSPSGALR